MYLACLLFVSVCQGVMAQVPGLPAFGLFHVHSHSWTFGNKPPLTFICFSTSVLQTLKSRIGTKRFWKCLLGSGFCFVFVLGLRIMCHYNKIGSELKIQSLVVEGYHRKLQEAIVQFASFKLLECCKVQWHDPFLQAHCKFFPHSESGWWNQRTGKIYNSVVNHMLCVQKSPNSVPGTTC